MGRPPKDKQLLLNVPLPIMLTAHQKEMIDRAASIEQSEMSEWARPILLEAAQEVIAKAESLATKKVKK